MLAWLQAPRFALALASVLGGCGNDAPAPPTALDKAASHARMLTKLQRIAGNVTGADRFLGEEDLHHTQAQLAALPAAADASRRHELLVMLGVHQLRLGSTAEAVASFDLAAELLPRLPDAERPRAEATLLFHQALARLRQGESENCVACNNAESCLFPLTGGGVHALNAGSLAARDALLALLRHPACPPSTAMVARWLLNIACMTLGQWPDGVPEPWRIEPAVFEPDEPFTSFKQVAAAVGLANESLSGGAVVDDLTGDGLLDVLVSTWHYRGQMHLFRNEGDGGFTDVTEGSGLEGHRGGLNLLHADIDGDGDNDVFVLRGAWFDARAAIPTACWRTTEAGTSPT